jgi:tRNA-2-methylthio-N6-dimethylallyladenosine synthase
MTYLLETYGCQMNKAESAALEIIFRERGWAKAPEGVFACSSHRELPNNNLEGAFACGSLRELPNSKEPGLGDSRSEPQHGRTSAGEAPLPDDVDMVVINTCSVRATAENRAWGRIDLYAAVKRERAAARAKRLVLVVTGCMAERLKEDIKKRQPAVDYVVGTFQKQAFGLVLDAVEQGKHVEDIDESPVFAFAPSYYESGSFRSFVPIMHGCDNFCAYCIVPYIRGREISRSPSAILAEIAALEDSGVREVTLLGQNVNSYRWKGNADQLRGSVATIDREPLDFPGLLRLISATLRARGKGGLRWMRFLSSHPKDLSDEVIRVLAEDPLYCKHVHLCVQSGSDAVLEAMNRRYTRDSYLALVGRMKAAIPGLSLSSDILVGFPGETEDDLELTLDLMSRVGYTYSYMYHFNPREGTPAASMPSRIQDKVKRERLARVIELQKAMTKSLMESRVGEVEEVLVESVSRRNKSEVLGRTQRDEMVVFPSPPSRVGSFAKVRLLSLSGNTFKAEELAS